ncbi:MAG: hypothetical protein PUF72_00040 [Clostridiales bacterium]|nr:hypothetical protein [Clostridiales bacterium]
MKKMYKLICAFLSISLIMSLFTVMPASAAKIDFWVTDGEYHDPEGFLDIQNATAQEIWNASLSGVDSSVSNIATITDMQISSQYSWRFITDNSGNNYAFIYDISSNDMLYAIKNVDSTILGYLKNTWYSCENKDLYVVNGGDVASDAATDNYSYRVYAGSSSISWVSSLNDSSQVLAVNNYMILSTDFYLYYNSSGNSISPTSMTSVLAYRFLSDTEYDTIRVLSNSSGQIYFYYTYKTTINNRSVGSNGFASNMMMATLENAGSTGMTYSESSNTNHIGYCESIGRMHGTSSSTYFLMPIEYNKQSNAYDASYSSQVSASAQTTFSDGSYPKIEIRFTSYTSASYPVLVIYDSEGKQIYSQSLEISANNFVNTSASQFYGDVKILDDNTFLFVNSSTNQYIKFEKAGTISDVSGGVNLGTVELSVGDTRPEERSFAVAGLKGETSFSTAIMNIADADNNIVGTALLYVPKDSSNTAIDERMTFVIAETAMKTTLCSAAGTYFGTASARINGTTTAISLTIQVANDTPKMKEGSDIVVNSIVTKNKGNADQESVWDVSLSEDVLKKIRHSGVASANGDLNLGTYIIRSSEYGETTSADTHFDFTLVGVDTGYDTISDGSGDTDVYHTDKEFTLTYNDNTVSVLRNDKTGYISIGQEVKNNLITAAKSGQTTFTFSGTGKVNGIEDAYVVFTVQVLDDSAAALKSNGLNLGTIIVRGSSLNWSQAFAVSLPFTIDHDNTDTSVDLYDMWSGVKREISVNLRLEDEMAIVEYSANALTTPSKDAADAIINLCGYAKINGVENVCVTLNLSVINDVGMGGDPNIMVLPDVVIIKNNSTTVTGTWQTKTDMSGTVAAESNPISSYFSVVGKSDGLVTWTCKTPSSITAGIYDVVYKIGDKTLSFKVRVLESPASGANVTITF